MDIDGYNLTLYVVYISLYMYVISGDVYDRLDYETHAKDKTMRYLKIREYNNIKHDD